MEHLQQGWVSHPWEIKPIYEMLNLSMKQHFSPGGPQNPMWRVQQKPGHSQEKYPLSTRCKEKEWEGRGWRSDFT